MIATISVKSCLQIMLPSSLLMFTMSSVENRAQQRKSNLRLFFVCIAPLVENNIGRQCHISGGVRKHLNLLSCKH